MTQINQKNLNCMLLGSVRYVLNCPSIISSINSTHNVILINIITSLYYTSYDIKTAMLSTTIIK